MQSHEDIVNAVFFVSVICVGFIDAVSGFRYVFICTCALKTAHPLIFYDIFKMQYIILPRRSCWTRYRFSEQTFRNVLCVNVDLI